MKLAVGIRRVGFRKWHERQLLQSHAHLLLTFLCLLGVFAAFETAMELPSWGQRGSNLLTAALCAAVGLWAMRRYFYLLHHAEFAANQAYCPACKAYGRLELVQSDASGERVQVRCRGCTQVWRIEL